jgi:4-amino-4-deoxy-L-arabinose transferase-like glycosyltransferase
MKTLSALIGVSAAFALALLVAGAWFFTVTCPDRSAASSVPWVTLYRFGENPWANVQALPNDWPPVSNVATAGASRHRDGDHSPWMDSCERDTHSLKAKTSS